MSEPDPSIDADLRGLADLRIKPVRHPGRWIVGGIAIAVTIVVLIAFARADIDYGATLRYFVYPAILRGMLATLGLTVGGMVLGLVTGLISAIMKLSLNPVLRSISSFYVWLFRGVPLLVQLLIWFNLAIVVPTIGIPGVFSVSTNHVMSPFLAALLGLGICEGAYVSEIIRSGVASVVEGQRDAAAALGMSRGLALRRVILPQSLRVMLPPLGNEVVIMLKNSSLAYTISFTELLRAANNVYTTNFLVIELLFTASLWYLVLTSVFSLMQHVLERRLSRSVGRPAPMTLRARVLRNLRPGRIA